MTSSFETIMNPLEMSVVLIVSSLLQDKGDHFEGASVENKDDYSAKQREAVCQEHICHPHLRQGDETRLFQFLKRSSSRHVKRVATPSQHLHQVLLGLDQACLLHQGCLCLVITGDYGGW